MLFCNKCKFSFFFFRFFVFPPERTIGWAAVTVNQLLQYNQQAHWTLSGEAGQHPRLPEQHHFGSVQSPYRKYVDTYQHCSHQPMMMMMMKAWHNTLHSSFITTSHRITSHLIHWLFTKVSHRLRASVSTSSYTTPRNWNLMHRSKEMLNSLHTPPPPHPCLHHHPTLQTCPKHSLPPHRFLPFSALSSPV